MAQEMVKQRAGTQRYQRMKHSGWTRPWWQSNVQNMEPGPLQRRWEFPEQIAVDQPQSATGQEFRQRPSIVVHTFTPSTKEAETGGSLSQSSLQSEFQVEILSQTFPSPKTPDRGMT